MRFSEAINMTDNTVQVTSVDRLGQELVEDVFSLFVDLLKVVFRAESDAAQ